MQIQMRAAVALATDIHENDAAINSPPTEFAAETGDEVMVAFAHGDPRFPYVIGSLWNGEDKPPVKKADTDAHAARRAVAAALTHVNAKGSV